MSCTATVENPEPLSGSVSQVGVSVTIRVEMTSKSAGPGVRYQYSSVLVLLTFFSSVPCAFSLFVRVDSAPVFHLGLAPAQRGGSKRAGPRGGHAVVSARRAGARTEEINSKSLWGAFQDRAGEEISGQAGISNTPEILCATRKGLRILFGALWFFEPNHCSAMIACCLRASSVWTIDSCLFSLFRAILLTVYLTRLLEPIRGEPVVGAGRPNAGGISSGSLT
jgi:hypothetical protein